jgi:hypothetical protein
MIAFVPTDKPGFERDASSKAVSIVSSEERKKFKLDRDVNYMKTRLEVLERSQKTTQEEINMLKKNCETIREIKEELESLKATLRNSINK